MMFDLVALLAENRFSRCPVCEGLAVLSLSDGKKIACKECNGKGVVKIAK